MAAEKGVKKSKDARIIKVMEVGGHYPIEYFCQESLMYLFSPRRDDSS